MPGHKLKYFKLSLQYSLSLWCDDSFNLTTVFSEPELFLTLFASCVLLLYMCLGHLIFWEAAGSYTTARLQHLMYQVLSPWQFHSKSNQCFHENNVFIKKKKVRPRVLKWLASFGKSTKSVVRMSSWTSTLLQLQSFLFSLIQFDFGTEEK